MKEILSALVIFATHTIEGITGFGSSVLALPFLEPALGLELTVQLLCILSWSMALYIIIRSWQAIQWKEFLFIVLWAGLGMPVGIWMFDRLPAGILCVILGIFMVFVGVRGVNSSYKSAEQPQTPVKRTLLMKALLFAGGIIQGAFGTGGPFIVIYSARALPEKRVFRVTLSLLWFSINSCRLIFWLSDGRLTAPESTKALLWAFPVMLAGVILGDYLHNKVSERNFKIGAYAILVLSGIFMTINNLF